MDWGIGHYEDIATQLLPVAQRVVDAAAPGDDERMVDVGCGTGNAALLAAARGAQVIGVDPALRLLKVARRRAVNGGLEASFLCGEAAALPLEDGSVDLVLSVSAVLFFRDPYAAVAEMARITATEGRIVLQMWFPEDIIWQANRIEKDAITKVFARDPEPPSFPWHEPDRLAALVAPYGFELAVQEHYQVIKAESPQAFREQVLQHPLKTANRAVLEPQGKWERVLDRQLEIYEAANEDPTAFQLTRNYLIAIARRK